MVVGWFVGPLVGWLARWVIHWPVLGCVRSHNSSLLGVEGGWGYAKVRWLLGRFVGWIVVGKLVGWAIGWLVG